MRITDSGSYAHTQRQLGTLTQRYAENLKEASSGIRVTKPSDDPTAVNEASRVQSSLAYADRLFNNAEHVHSDGILAETALAQSGTLLMDARSVAIQGGNDSLSTDARVALADRVAAQRSQLIGLANTQGASGYLFGGTETDTPPFSDVGVFQGNTDERLVELLPGRPGRVNVDGADAFTVSGGVDVFNLLGDLETALRNDDADAVRATLPDLELAESQIGASRSDAGAVITRALLAKAALERSKQALVQRNASLTNSDATFALSELSSAQAALEQALVVAQKTVLNRKDF